MKYTLEGFSQEMALKLTKEIKKNDEIKILKLDIIDLVLLRWFVDFFPNMKKKNVDDIQYAWVNYTSVVEELPILYIQKQSVYQRFAKMCELGVLVHYFDKAGGSYSYYGFGENYSKLISGSVSVTQAPEGGQYQNIEGGQYQNIEGSISKYRGVNTKISRGQYQNIEGVNIEISTKDPSTINPSTISSTPLTPQGESAPAEKLKTTLKTGSEEKEGRGGGRENKKENEKETTPTVNASTTDSEKSTDGFVATDRDEEDALKYIHSVTNNKQLQEKIMQFLQVRKVNGKPVTIEYLKVMFRQLERFAGGDFDTKIQVLEQNIAHNRWSLGSLEELSTWGNGRKYSSTPAKSGKTWQKGGHWSSEEEINSRYSRFIENQNQELYDKYLK